MKNKYHIDFSSFQERTANDVEMQKELFFTIKKESHKYQNLLIDACMNNSMSELRDSIHRLKSSFALFGFNDLINDLDKLKSLSKLNDKTSQNIIKKIFQDLDLYLSELEIYINSKL
jgi:hypothetical protein